MAARRSFPEVLELVLLAALAIGFVLIAQRASQALFQVGLGVVVVSTFLEIAVGNIAAGTSIARSVLLIALILCLIGVVFGAGIFLVPYLANLGR